MTRIPVLSLCLTALSLPLSAQFAPDQLMVVSAGTGGIVSFDLGGTNLADAAPMPDGAPLVDSGLTFQLGPGAGGDVAFGPDGRLYIAAIGEGALTLVDSDGSTTTLGEELTEFLPAALAFGADGHLYVGSSIGSVNSLHEFDATGAYVRAFGPASLNVSGLAVGPGGHFYVSSLTADTVKVLDRDGKLVRNITLAGAIEDPREVAVGPDGNLWIASEGKDKLFVYATNGSPVNSFNGAGLLDGPVGLAFGSDGTLYVSNRGSSQITAFSLPADITDTTPQNELGHIASLAAPSLSGALGLALSPRRFDVKLKGSLAAPGLALAKLSGTGVLSLDLGARQALLLVDESLAAALGTPALGMWGFWGTEDDAAKRSLLHFTQVRLDATKAGTAALQLQLSSKLDKSTGRGLPKKATGLLTSGGSAGVVVLSLKAKPVKP